MKSRCVLILFSIKPFSFIILRKRKIDSKWYKLINFITFYFCPSNEKGIVLMKPATQWPNRNLKYHLFSFHSATFIFANKGNIFSCRRKSENVRCEWHQSVGIHLERWNEIFSEIIKFLSYEFEDNMMPSFREENFDFFTTSRVSFFQQVIENILWILNTIYFQRIRIYRCPGSNCKESCQK